MTSTYVGILQVYLDNKARRRRFFLVLTGLFVGSMMMVVTGLGLRFVKK